MMESSPRLAARLVGRRCGELPRRLLPQIQPFHNPVSNRSVSLGILPSGSPCEGVSGVQAQGCIASAPYNSMVNGANYRCFSRRRNSEDGIRPFQTDPRSDCGWLPSTSAVATGHLICLPNWAGPTRTECHPALDGIRPFQPIRWSDWVLSQVPSPRQTSRLRLPRDDGRSGLAGTAPLRQANRCAVTGRIAEVPVSNRNPTSDRLKWSDSVLRILALRKRRRECARRNVFVLCLKFGDVALACARWDGADLVRPRRPICGQRPSRREGWGTRTWR